MARQPTEVRRRQIAEATLQIISRDGLGRFTTAAIAAEIGISEGALFRHFANKAEIVGAAVDVIEELLGDLPMPENGGDPLAQLGAFFRARVALMNRHPGIFRLLFSDQLAQAASPEVEARIQRLQQRSLKFVRGCLQRAADLGLLAADADIPTFFTIVHGTAMALAFATARRQSPVPVADPDRVWHTLETLLRK